MKKLFASLLAATMVAGMAVSAFAVTEGYTTITRDDSTFAVEADSFYLGNVLGLDTKLAGGSTIKFPIVITGEKKEDLANVDRFSKIEKLTASVKATRGGKYVGDAVIKKDKDLDMYVVEVKLGDYYSDEETEVEFDVILKNKGREQDRVAISTMLVNEPLGTVTEKKDEAKVDIDAAGLVEFKPSTTNIILTSKKNNVEFEVKAAKQGAVDVRCDNKIVKDIVIANPDADLYFVNFPARPEFDFTGTLTFFVPDDEKEWFLYEVVDADAPALAAAEVLAGATKKVVATNAKYNAEDACFELKTRVLGSYVLSDKELVVTAEKPADEAEKPADEAKPADKVVGTGAIA